MSQKRVKSWIFKNKVYFYCQQILEICFPFENDLYDIKLQNYDSITNHAFYHIYCPVILWFQMF